MIELFSKFLLFLFTKYDFENYVLSVNMTVLILFRYLFQTLKNYPKPVVAIISSAATGLAASLLSLVDVVYDQVSTSVLFYSSAGVNHLCAAFALSY